MEEMVQRISPRTKLFGLFGNPVSHSLSPLMHNLALSKTGIDGVYLAFHVCPEHLESALQSVRSLGMSGVNITVPYKYSILPFLDEIRGDAVSAGSINTIHNEDGRLIGYSTDGAGLLRSLKEEMGWTPGGESAIILGTGGAAAAIAFSLVGSGISRLMIAARSDGKNQELNAKIYTKTGFQGESANFAQTDLAEKAKDFSLVINTTPLGMSSYDGASKPPFSPGWIRENGICCDLIYNPLKTEWLREAESSGRRILSGLGMLIYQGAESFRIWTGHEMPVTEVRQHLRAHMEE